jgi:CDP-glucose 4,6-dehydratase
VTAPLPDPGFWSGRRVLLTGHSGFKGAWAALWLQRLGARVTGLALPAAKPSLCRLAGVGAGIDARHADLRDADAVAGIVREARPEIVLHLAAQPLVRQSLRDPIESFAVNVMGTLHLLDALRHVDPPSAILVVTTDKVYADAAGHRACHEDDRLGGGDPYAASKAACELATAAMARNFLRDRGTAVATARAGNVVGGGDFAADRLIPDIVRAARQGRMPVIRHPHATRPWQHVLDCLSGYLVYTEFLAAGHSVPPALNFGPDSGIALPVAAVAAAMARAMGLTHLRAFTPGFRDLPAKVPVLQPSHRQNRL